MHTYIGILSLKPIFCCPKSNCFPFSNPLQNTLSSRTLLLCLCLHLVRAGQDAVWMMRKVNDAPDNEVSLTNCSSVAAWRQIFPDLWLGESRYKMHSPLPGQHCIWELHREVRTSLLKAIVLLKINPVHLAVFKVTFLFSSRELKSPSGEFWSGLRRCCISIC